MIFWVYIQIILATFLGCIDCGGLAALRSLHVSHGMTDYVYSASPESIHEDNSGETESIYELFRMQKYKEAFHELSEVHLTREDCLLLGLSVSQPLIPPLLVVATLFLLSANHHLSSIFCSICGKEEVRASLKGMIAVILLFFLLPYVVFNPFSRNYVEKVCLSVYLHNKPTVPLSHYYLTNSISLFIIPLYYMKRNQISVRSLFSVNVKSLRIISRYLYRGVLWLVLLFILTIIMQLVLNSTLSSGISARRVPINHIGALGLPYIIYVAIAGPLFEEICFRGMIFLSLRKYFRRYVSIIFSALLFMFIPSHMVTPTGMVGAFGIGILFALLTHETESLWPSFLLHVAWNSIFLTIILLF